MDDKTTEQLLEELTEVQKMLEERTEIKGQMIRKLQMIISNDRLFSQIIDFFPYPIAIFTPQYTLTIVNKAFATETKMPVKNPVEGAVRILQYKIDDTQLTVAVRRVFAGETFYLEDLKNPFSMFSGNIQPSALQLCSFNKAVIFPVSADDVEITHGVIVLMP